jgi:cyclophilin family peptidyl-prolyl cis-trans isomerase
VPRLLAILIASLALLVAACGGEDDRGSEAESEATPAAETPVAEATPPPNEFLPEGCENVAKPAPKEVGDITAPEEKLDADKTYVATVSTTCGDFEITLDAKRAPITSGSFANLANQGFYDGTTFHRIVPNFVIQGGDPAGDGSGGPGFSVEEAPPSSLKYEEGIVAMAKTGAEPAGTSGSQFFVVTGPDALQLTPDYALLGEVTKGMDVATKIGGIQADPNTGMPAAQVIINSIKVVER